MIPGPEHWLALASAGYYLSPMRVRRGSDGRKRITYYRDDSRDVGWGEMATTDPETITGWLQTYGPDVGFLIATQPSGIVVVDLDAKPHADGLRWWSEAGFPLPLMTVDTPSGGMHLYYRQDDVSPVANSAGAIAPGVDVRGVGATYGGLVHAPGTVVDGGEGGEVYRLTAPLLPVTELEPLPPEVTEAIPEPRRHRSAHASADKGQGRRHDLDWVRATVRDLSEGAVGLSGGEFRYALMGAAMMAGRLVVAGAVERDRAETELEKIPARTFGAPNDDDRRWIAQGLDDGMSDPFTIVPARDEPADPEDEPDEYARRWNHELERERIRRDVRRHLDAEERGDRAPLVFTWDDDLEDITPPPMLLPELIPGRAMGWLGGPSGSYKSFVAVALASALAHGHGALGDAELAPRRPVRVLYVAAEDPFGVKWRTRALRHHLGLDGREGRLAITDRAVNIADPFALAEMTHQAVEAGVEFLIVDTFRQSTPGLNENDNGEVGLVLSRLAALRDQHGIGSLIVDHTNKSAAGPADLGGAGIKRANADYMLMVDLANGDRTVGAQRTLRVAKMKNKGDGRTWPIRLERVGDVVDAEGDAAAVAVIGQVDSHAAGIHGDDDWTEVRLPEDVRDYEGTGRESLGIVTQLAIRFGSGESGVSRSEIVGHYRAARPEVSRNVANKRVAKAWDALIGLGRLSRVGNGQSRITHHTWNTEPVFPYGD